MLPLLKLTPAVLVVLSGFKRRIVHLFVMSVLLHQLFLVAELVERLIL